MRTSAVLLGVFRFLQKVDQIDLTRIGAGRGAGQAVAPWAARGRAAVCRLADAERVAAHLGGDQPAGQAFPQQKIDGLAFLFGQLSGPQDLDVIQQYPGFGVSRYAHRRGFQSVGGDGRMRREAATSRRDLAPRLRCSADSLVAEVEGCARQGCASTARLLLKQEINRRSWLGFQSVAGVPPCLSLVRGVAVALAAAVVAACRRSFAIGYAGRCSRVAGAGFPGGMGLTGGWRGGAARRFSGACA